MKSTSFGSATVESGPNQGKPRTLSFATGIKPEQANGLPVKKNDKGVEIVYLEISPASIPVVEFETRAEVEAAAGENFDAFVVDSANAAVIAKVRGGATTGARKLELPPTDKNAWAKQIGDAVTAESALMPGTVASKKVEVSRIVELSSRTDMTDAEKLAAILAMVNAK